MKAILLATLLISLPAFGQANFSPEVQSDGRVTFRLRAPDAKDVQVHCEEVPTSAMQRGADGIWTLTTEPLQPDFYAYSFTVDGVRLTDPANPLIKYNLLNTESQVHVPGPNTLLWELNDVPHGELHTHFYHSKVADDDRNFIVYTPPGYNPSARKRYPVLYLLHGYSDDTTAWTSVGRANVILDNLIARGQAKPMIVVMPLGYGTMKVVTAGWSHVGDRHLWQENLDKFQDALLTEVVPQVERTYHIQKGRELHAIAGLSMGGAESLVVGLNHLDQFGWVGSFSAGGLNGDFAATFPRLDAAADDKLHLLWIGCGKDDHLLDSNEQFCKWLTSQNVHYTWTESPGFHSFLVWRRYLGEFAPLLFQDKK